MCVEYSPLLETLRIVSAHVQQAGLTQSEDPVADFVITLPRLLGKKVQFEAPGEDRRSFDESWILSLSHALDLADADNYRFLLLSRMSREKASECHFRLRQALTRLEDIG
jgi:hypothetical protein